MSDRLSHLIDLVSDNLRLLLILGAGYFLGVDQGIIEPVDLPATPDLPVWWELAAIGTIAAIVAGYFYGGKIFGLLPEAPHKLLIVFTEDREKDHQIWKLTPDQFADMKVVNGTLYQWPGTSVPTYEALDYDPERNRAVATWRKSVPASEIVGRTDVDAAIEQITDLRDGFEKKARIGDEIQRRVGTILRRRDYQRARAQDRALEGHVAPSLGNEPTTDEVIAEVLGPDLAPDWMTPDEQADEIDGGTFDLIDADPEALVDVEEMTDGGREVDQ